MLFASCNQLRGSGDRSQYERFKAEASDLKWFLRGEERKSPLLLEKCGKLLTTDGIVVNRYVQVKLLHRGRENETTEKELDPDSAARAARLPRGSLREDSREKSRSG